jgi:hypothetical protein
LRFPRNIPNGGGQRFETVVKLTRGQWMVRPQIYQEGLWICGRSALPTGSAFPASRASSESEEMLAFAHIPIGAAANKGL